MPNTLNKLFKAISDPTRREIFHLLVLTSATLSITQISSHFDISRQGITKHIKMLEQAGLVDLNGKGREKFCIANPKPLKEIQTWINFYQKFWDDKLDNLDNFLSNKTKS